MSETMQCEARRVLHSRHDGWFLQYEHEITYIKRGDTELHLQIIHPQFNTKELSKKFPCILFIQGSAWKKQDRFGSLARLGVFAQRGYAVASIEYRPSDVAHFPGQILDAKAAIDYIYQNADQYNIDRENLLLWGNSSGAHTALMAGMTAEMADMKEADVAEHTIRGIIDFYSPTDLILLTKQESAINHEESDSPEGRVLGNVKVTDELELAHKASILPYAAKENDLPPILIVHGTKDPIIPIEQSIALYDQLVQAGKEVCMYQIPEAVHGGYEFWSEETMDLVEDFIDHCID